MAIALKNIVVINRTGTVLNNRQQGIWEFAVGNSGWSFYRSSFANQVKLAKQEAQKLGLTSITVIRKIA